MVDYIHSTTPARGFDKVRVPGDPERESARRARIAMASTIDEQFVGGHRRGGASRRASTMPKIKR